MNHYRALLIDSHAADVRRIREMLRGEVRVNVDLESASTLKEGLLKLGLGRDSYDVVLVDVALPDSAGPSTFDRLHHRFPLMPVILLAGDSDIDDAVRSVKAGAQEYLIKSEIAGGPLVRAIQYAVERKRTDEALRNAERLYRSIVENTQEGIAIIDAEGKVKYANARMAAMGGWTSVSELIGRSMTEFMDPDSVALAANSLRKTLRGSVQQVDLKLFRKDGAPVWVIVATNPLTDDAGNTAGALAVVTDITDRHVADEARRKLAAIVESSRDAIIGCSVDGIISTWNSGAEQIYGYSGAQVIGKHVDILAPPDRKSDVAATLSKLRDGKGLDFETVGSTRDGRRIEVAMTISPVRDAAGRVVDISAVARDVTERKHAEERFRFAAEMLSDVLFEWDLDERLTWVGDIDRLMGYDSGEFPRILERWLALVHPEDMGRVHAAIQSGLHKGQTYAAEYRVRRKDGTYAIWTVRGTAIRDAGEIIRWVGAISDVTAQRQMQEKLRDSEETYRRLVANVPDVVWTADAARVVSFISENVEEIVGYSPSEIVETASWVDAIHRDDRERVLTSWAALFVRDETFDIEFRLRRRDGTWAWIHDRSVGTYVRDGVRYADGVLNDVTRRKEQQEALRRVARDRELLLESTGEGIYAMDNDGICTMANRVAALLLGRTTDELIGRNMHDLLHGRKPDGTPYAAQQCPVYDTIRAGKSARITDEVFWRKDGTSFPVEYNSSPIVDDGVIRGAVVTFSDVSERRKLERRLEQVSRIGSLGRMAATIGHEFNNVLMGIQPFAEIIRRVASGDPKLEQAATHILNSVARGRSITQDIMRVTRPAEPALQSVDLSGWITQLAEEIRGMLPPAIRIEVEVPKPGTLFARIDPVQMQQVLTNLATNARDAMSGSASGRLTIAAKKHGESARMVVADTGCGIAADILPYVFEPLFTTKKSGTGLGLSVAQQIVVSNGGSVNVESVVGKGTEFQIDVPLTSPSVAVVDENERVSPRDFGVERIVIVEDDADVASGLSAILESDGVEVKVVGLGREAMNAVELFDPDVVIIDISLPDIDGTAVYEELVARWPGIRAIFSTGHADETNLPHMNSERVGFLRKPYGIETLFAKLREVAGAARVPEPAGPVSLRA